MEANKVKFLKKIQQLQKNIKVKKDQVGYKNKYRYRSLESIYAEIKEEASKEGLLVTVETSLISVGQQVAIEAKVWVTDLENPALQHGANGFCILDTNGSKMGIEQSTGSAQTYAIRYAMQNLLLMDDNVDVDSPEFQEEKQEEENKKSIAELAKQYNVPEERILIFIRKKFGKNDIEHLESGEYKFMLKKIVESI